MSGILTYKCSFGPYQGRNHHRRESRSTTPTHSDIFSLEKKKKNGLVVQSGYHGFMVYCGIRG